MLTPTSLLLGASLGLFQSARLFADRNQTQTLQLQGWPSHFEGTALHPTSLSSNWINLLSQQFTGESASFRSAGKEVILRRASRGTRRLQAAETCLRNAGYHPSERHLDTEGWLCYFMEKDHKQFHVREQITDGKTCWNSPSSWFWHATAFPKNGPWLAITVITPVH